MPPIDSDLFGPAITADVPLRIKWHGRARQGGVSKTLSGPAFPRIFSASSSEWGDQTPGFQILGFQPQGPRGQSLCPRALLLVIGRISRSSFLETSFRCLLPLSQWTSASGKPLREA